MIIKGGRLTKMIMPLQVYMSIIYILATPLDASPNQNPEGGAKLVNYGVLLDAGSTSTKLKIYRWNPSASNSLVPKIDLISNVRFQTGLNNYENDQEGLSMYLTSIVSRAKDEVPSDKQAETPIFLMATAGLRFLTAAEARTFLADIRSVMADKTINPFLYNPSSVTILSGEKEGVYSWIAANYLLGFFDTYRPENESIGVLEMGGGSTQITFIPNGPLFSEEYQVIMAGRPYHLYVQSYLHYGSNAIKLKVAHELTQRYPGQDVVANPCMLIGDTRTATLDDGRVLQESGTGSPALCLQLLREILKPYTGIRCQPKPCAIGSVHQPSVGNTKFLATQGFTYTPETLKAVGTDKILLIDRLEEAAIRHCNRSLYEAVSESGASAPFASDDCLMGLYIPTLLTTSYKFSRNTTNIKVTSNIGTGAIDWALGAMLVELSNSFSSSRSNFTVKCPSNLKIDYVKGHNSSISVYPWTSCILLLSILLCIISHSNIEFVIVH
uniref:Uncharacterized protein n=1 Tax=Arion vulgaris TaxID=1028688 RepID=A0A0B7BG01_9EUPU